MPVLVLSLGADNARAGNVDERVDLVLLERTLLEPPRLAAMQRWSAAVRRRFPNAQQIPYVWHLVSHAREDGIRGRAIRRPAGDESAFGGLQTTDEVQRAWDVTRLCMQGCGSTRVVLRTGPSITPGAIGRKRISAFVEARTREGVGVIWEPEGLWEADVARVFARELGVSLCLSALEGGRPRYAEGGPSEGVLLGRDVWLRVGGSGPRGRLDGSAIDALAEHCAVVPDATIVFTGPRALAHLREVNAFLAV
jgi:hypothetical protein